MSTLLATVKLVVVAGRLSTYRKIILNSEVIRFSLKLMKYSNQY